MTAEEKASRLTDKELEKLEKRIAKEYKTATEGLEQTLREYLEASAKRIAAHKELLDAGEITQKQFNDYVRAQHMTGARWAAMRDRLAQEYANISVQTIGWTREKWKDIYIINYNATLEHLNDASGVNLSYTMYNREAVERMLVDNPQVLPLLNPKREAELRAKNELWNMRKVESAVLQGILQGDSIPKLANRLQTVQDMNIVQARRAARTAINGAENGARQDASHGVKDELEQYGYSIKKKWSSTTDSRTREEHLEANGQIVDIDEPFIVGGEELMFPCDFEHGSGWNVYNCRCRRSDVLVKVGAKH